MSLSCTVCKKYESKIWSLKNFTNAWITGSTNLKSTNVLDHANSAVHKAAMGHMRVDVIKASGQSPMMCSPIGQYLTTLDSRTQARMKKKFDVCYLMAKQGIAFSKYPALLELEARHDVDLAIAYSTPDSAKSFTGYIAKSQRQAFLTKFCCESHFYSVLTDGTTDAGNLEDELIALAYCCRNDTTQEITATTRYWSIHNPEKANADGILKCLSESLQLLGVENLMDKESVLGVEDKPVLVGVGTDGATVNVGGSTGLRGKIQQELPWIYWSWCYAHRLELACKDAFCSPLFSFLQEMLLRVYYLYEKSPKKLRELASLVDDLKEVFDFPKGGDKPIRCQGTRWISHKRRALQRVLDRYGAYITHLIALVEDPALKSIDRAKLNGYLRLWKQSKVLVGCAMYVEVLKPASILSLTLQDDSADIVTGMENTLKSMNALKCLQRQEPQEWPTVKLMKGRIDEHQQYQGVTLENFDDTFEQCKGQVLADVERLQNKVKERLAWSDTDLLRAILVFLETQNWLCKCDNIDDISEIKAAVEQVITHFRIPLEAKGVSVEVIQDEIEEAVQYARKYLAIDTKSYKKIWYTLHTCPDSRKWPNVLLLCELLFSLPIATSRVEQTFSIVKVVKTKRRTSLHTSTLCDLLEICVEGPPLSSFSANGAVNLWWHDSNTTRRVNQQP